MLRKSSNPNHTCLKTIKEKNWLHMLSSTRRNSRTQYSRRLPKRSHLNRKNHLNMITTILLTPHMGIKTSERGKRRGKKNKRRKKFLRSRQLTME